MGELKSRLISFVRKILLKFKKKLKNVDIYSDLLYFKKVIQNGSQKNAELSSV